MSSSPISSSSSDGLHPPTPYDKLGALACRVTIVLGTGSITVRQCLALERGVVLRLLQPAREDLRVAVNGVTIARGEVAVLDASAAIRITELVAPNITRGAAQ